MKHYKAILDAVKIRGENNQLAITIYGDGNQPNRYVKVNGPDGPDEKWVTVNKLDRNVNQLFPLYDELPFHIGFVGEEEGEEEFAFEFEF